LTKHVEPARAALAAAILEVAKAEAAAVKSDAAITKASLLLRQAEEDRASAATALEFARAPRRRMPVDQSGMSQDELWELAEEVNVQDDRPAPSGDDLRKMRQALEAADDDVAAARPALDIVRDQARPATSALNRAKDARQRAVYAVSQPEISRLISEAQDLVERLGAVRAALGFVVRHLVDGLAHGDDRRRAESFLNRPAYPEESGLWSENDQTRRNAALAAWTQFAAKIAEDAATPFPTGVERFPRG
jgi:hypothetical protein